MSTNQHKNLLTKEEILKRIEDGDLSFKPKLDQFQIQPHSIDLRLGFTFMVPKFWEMTADGREAIQVDYTKSQDTFEVIELEPGQYFDILPDEYVIFSTLETMTIPNDLMAVLYPRSSVNRRGLSIDLSGIVDAGYDGQLIIPVRNNTRSQTIRVYPGERFCQLVFHPLSEPINTEESRFHQKDVALTIGSRSEKYPEEVEYIRSGDIKDLKDDHGISS